MCTQDNRKDKTIEKKNDYGVMNRFLRHVQKTIEKTKV